MDIHIIFIYGSFCFNSFEEIFLHDFLSLNFKFLHFLHCVTLSEKQNISAWSPQQTFSCIKHHERIKLKSIIHKPLSSLMNLPNPTPSREGDPWIQPDRTKLHIIEKDLQSYSLNHTKVIFLSFFLKVVKVIFFITNQKIKMKQQKEIAIFIEDIKYDDD